jgi:hypothetical protein
MTHPTTRVLAPALLAAALAVSLWSPPLDGQEKPRKPEDAKSSSEDALTRALERRLASTSRLGDVMVDIRWRYENDYVRARLFGDGVGVWNRSVGFRVPPAEARSLIRKFAAVHFGSLPDSAGEEESRVLTGRIIVSAGAVRKTVSQMAEGEQSPELSELAQRILRLSKKAAEGGVRVSSFQDGFAQQISGKLAPGALEVHVQRKPATGGKAGPEAWTLRISGGYAYDRELGSARRSDVTRQLRLSAADFLALVRELFAANVGALPGNLYAPIYTDLDVTLLDQHKNIQARDFAGMTPQTHGERQQAFDRLVEALEALHSRMLRDGRSVEAIDLVGPDHREHERENDPDRD